MDAFNLSASAFIEELLSVSTDLVWKNQATAYANEDQLNSVDVEQYMTAVKGMLSFETIFQFSYEVLQQVGLSITAIEAAMDDKLTIPLAVRSICTKLQIAYIKEHYEEQNDYYRMLFGLPDTEDTEYLYNTAYPEISDALTPIHELSIDIRKALEDTGYITTLIKDNPSKKYLKYIGDRNIPIYTSRSADRFAILWMNDTDYENMNSDFREVYNQSKNVINRVYYSDAFRKDNSMYEGFLAMSILFMSIQLMHYRYLDADITRDFYDLDSIKYIYESYGVPFYQSIPEAYHKEIVKNINLLLSYKGSNRVFFELFDLFDYGDMTIYQYYLMKIHKFENGLPIFVKKVDGSYDNRAMYNLKFGQVLEDRNTPMELADTANHVDYDTMTDDDIYWISDDTLMNKLYDEEEFNYIETKYVGIQTVMDMMKIMYESTYYFKIIFDNRAVLAASFIYFNPIGNYTDLYSLAVYVSALICKKYGYAGNISTALPNISKVMGWNFKENMIALKAAAAKDKYLGKDTDLLNLLVTMNVQSLASVDTIYAKIKELREYIIEKMATTHDKNTYQQYSQLYNTLMYSSLIESGYKKVDGTVALTFADLLQDCNPSLYTRLSDISLDIASEIDDVLVIMKKSATNLKYLEMADGLDISNVIDYLFKMLDFFKSGKSDLTGYNIIYTLSHRGDNMMKFLALIDVIHDDYAAYSDEIPEFVSVMKKISDTYITKKDISIMMDKFKIPHESHILKSHMENISSQLLSLMDTYITMRDNSDIIKDFINRLSYIIRLEDALKYQDTLYSLIETIEEIISIEYHDESGVLIDRIRILPDSTICHITDMSIKDKLKLISEIPE